MKKLFNTILFFGVMLGMTLLVDVKAYANAGDPLCFTAEEAGSTIIFGYEEGYPPENIVSLEYSIDNKTTWNPYTLNQTITLSNVNDNVYFRNIDKTDKFSKYTGWYQFFMTGKIGASGDITTLLDKEGNVNSLPKDCFMYLFCECTALTTPPELPSLELKGQSCYSYMFEGCTSLRYAPELPATELCKYAYMYMFKGCTSLERGPSVLPAQLLCVNALEGWGSCYYGMFEDCFSLTTAPKLESKTIPYAAYGAMFKGCTSLVEIPDIIATSTGKLACENMFEGCTSLKTVGEISITSPEECCFRETFKGCTSFENIETLSFGALGINCCQNMFEGCTSLKSIGTISATTLAENCFQNVFNGCNALESVQTITATTLANGCCSYMFEGCTSLKTVGEISATTLAENCFQYMFSGCTALENAPALTSTTLANGCYSYMFSGCTALETAPALPAITLKPNCYQGMFEGCTSLVNAPELLAGTMATSCYQGMFKNCTSLVDRPDLPARFVAPYCYKEMFMGCKNLAESSTFYDSSIVQGGDTTGFDENMFSASSAPVLVRKGNKLILKPGKDLTKDDILYDGYSQGEIISVEIMQGVNSIPKGAFKHTKISDVTIPEGVRVIEDHAFWQCEGLSTVNFPSTLKTIGQSAFEDCAVWKIVLNEGLENIGRYAFDGLYNDKDFVIPKTVRKFGLHTIERPNLASAGTIVFNGEGFTNKKDSLNDLNNSEIDCYFYDQNNDYLYIKHIEDGTPVIGSVYYNGESVSVSKSSLTDLNSSASDCYFFDSTSNKLYIKHVEPNPIGNGVYLVNSATTTLSKKDSKTDLDNSESACYFYDETNKKLYVKYIDGTAPDPIYVTKTKTVHDTKEVIKEVEKIISPNSITGYDDNGNKVIGTLNSDGTYTIINSSITPVQTISNLDRKALLKDLPSKGIKLVIGLDECGIDGVIKKQDAPAEVIDGVTFLPIRLIAEYLGAKVSWDAKSPNRVEISKGDKTIVLTIGSKVALVNEKEYTLDYAPYIKYDRTYLPVRFISEHLGAVVEWSEKSPYEIIIK